MSTETKFTECPWAVARDPKRRCGWTGRADKYDKHLQENHGGKEPAPGEHY